MPSQRLCDLNSNNDLITGLPPSATPREHATIAIKVAKWLDSEMRKSQGFVMNYRTSPSSVHLSTDVNLSRGRSGNGQSVWDAIQEFESEGE